MVYLKIINKTTVAMEHIIRHLNVMASKLVWCSLGTLYWCLHVPVSHVVLLSAGSPHSLEETEAAGRETGKNNKYLGFS